MVNNIPYHHDDDIEYAIDVVEYPDGTLRVITNYDIKS